MTQRPNGPPDDQAPGLADAAPRSPADTWRDWVTIWQSELSALATDREAQRAWATLIAFWAAHARAAGALLPVRGDPSIHERAPGRARPEPPAGAAAAAAAPDDGGAERQRLAIERLAQRVEELERRIAELGGDVAG